MKSNKGTVVISLFVSLFIVFGTVSSALAGPIPLGMGEQETATAISLGFDYLRTQLNEDGGIRWFDENSSPAATLRVVLALASAGYRQDFLHTDSGIRPIDYLLAQANAWVNQKESDNPGFSVARAGQLLTAAAAANENPNRFGQDGINLIRDVKRQYDPATGVFGSSSSDNVLDQVWAMIGLAANNASVPEEAAAWLIAVQEDDGSWNDGFGSFLDTTPLGILALLSSEHNGSQSPALQSAVNYIQENQQPSGGWQSEWDTTTNANTTAAMIQAIVLLGQNPEGENWQKPEGTPSSALLALQGENGAFGGDFSNAYATADAIIALSKRSITDLGALEIASDGFDFIFNLQEPDGGWGSVGQTIDVLLALRAAGWQPNSIVAEQGAPLDFIANNLDAYLESGPDAIGKAILGLVSAGEDPTNFNGTDLIVRLQAAYDPEAGAFGDPSNTWHQALAILGLYAGGGEIPEGAVETLRALQQEDGGWEYTPGFGTWPDNTALALQALLASGAAPGDPAILSAIDYFRTMQTPAGGWGDSSTTAFTLMAIHALGQSEQDWVSENAADPITALLTYQKANGSFVFSWEFTDDNLMSTTAALLALFDGSLLIEANLPDMPQQAAILVDPGDGTHYADCVHLDREMISGLDLLEKSAFSYSMQEGFLNSVMGIANPEGETKYWSYWFWNGREWRFKESGAGDSIVRPGMLEAWYLTSWEEFPSFPPNFIPDINQICSTTILKNFADQPHLDYNDLFDEPMQNVERPRPMESDAPAEPVIDTPAETDLTDQQGTEEPAESNSQREEGTDQVIVENRSDLPIIIIAAAGVLVLIVIVVLLKKKQK